MDHNNMSLPDKARKEFEEQQRFENGSSRKRQTYRVIEEKHKDVKI